MRLLGSPRQPRRRTSQPTSSCRDRQPQTVPVRRIARCWTGIPDETAAAPEKVAGATRLRPNRRHAEGRVQPGANPMYRTGTERVQANCRRDMAVSKSPSRARPACTTQ
jgi:hypothetical protein